MSIWITKRIEHIFCISIRILYILENFNVSVGVVTGFGLIQFL